MKVERIAFDPFGPCLNLAQAGWPGHARLPLPQSTGSAQSSARSINPDGTYKKIPLAASLATKAYDVYYRLDSSSQWRRISSGVPGQKGFTFVNPNLASEGDYIFLDAADQDGNGLSDGHENWFTYLDSQSRRDARPVRECPMRIVL